MSTNIISFPKGTYFIQRHCLLGCQSGQIYQFWILPKFAVSQDWKIWAIWGAPGIHTQKWGGRPPKSWQFFADQNCIELTKKNGLKTDFGTPNLWNFAVSWSGFWTLDDSGFWFFVCVWLAGKEALAAAAAAQHGHIAVPQAALVAKLKFLMSHWTTHISQT